jgi:hypothetical protein
MQKCGHLLLRDTRGNFYLAVRLDIKKDRKQYFKEWYRRPGVKERLRQNNRNWRKNNPEKSRQIKRKWQQNNI